MYIFSYILKVYYYTRQHLRFSDISIDFIEARCFPGDKFCIKHCLTFKTPMEYGAAREKVRPSCAKWSHNSGSGWPARRGGFFRLRRSTTSRDCIVWDREETECRAVGSSKGGVFHLCQPPLDALAALAGLSRALYAAATPSSPLSTCV